MALAPFVNAVKQSRLLAPNLKEVVYTVYTTNSTRANVTAKLVVRDHLAALRWMNPNAVIHLKEIRGVGQPKLECKLCACGGGGAEGLRARWSPAPFFTHTPPPHPLPLFFSRRGWRGALQRDRGDQRR